MKDNLVQGLDDSHVIDGHMQVVMGQGLQLAAGEPRETDRGEPVAIGPVDGLENVRAVAGTGDRQQQVAGRRQVLELLQEDPIIALIVGPGHDSRSVVREAQNLQPLLILEVAEGALREVLAEMRRVGARTTVADDEDETTGIIRLFDQVVDVFDKGGVKPLDFVADPREVISRRHRRSEHAGSPCAPWTQTMDETVSITTK